MKMKMKIFIFLAIILLADIELISSQNDCWMFDFNDPLLLSDFTKCYGTTLTPLVLKKYDSSVEPYPYRATSTHYVSAPDRNMTDPFFPCSQSKPFAITAPANITIEMAYNFKFDISGGWSYVFLRVYSIKDNLYNALLDVRYSNSNNWRIIHETFTIPNGYADDVVVGSVKNYYFNSTKTKVIFQFQVYALVLKGFVAVEYVKIFTDNSSSSCSDYQAPSEEVYCKAIDFNQPSSEIFNDFKNCEDLQLPTQSNLMKIQQFLHIVNRRHFICLAKPKVCHACNYRNS